MAAVKRMMADISELEKPLQKESNIYQSVDESDVTHGYACIFGPKDTPQEDCPMLQEIQASATQPFDPPKVEFRTWDGKTRFHPNMQKEGKCCLSILHTWEGPKWASTMRISTILVTLQSLMDNDPLRHEPGYHSGHDERCLSYRNYVEIATIRQILDRAEQVTFEKGVSAPAFIPFERIFKEQLPAILTRLEARITKLIERGECHFVGLPYGLDGRTGYADALKRIVKLKAAVPV